LTLLAGAALGLVYMTVERLFDREQRLIDGIRALPTTEIRSVPDGERVKIVGAVMAAGPTLRAPLSQRECAFFTLRIDYLSGSERAVQHRGVDFLVRDASGPALVRMQGATPIFERSWRRELDRAQVAAIDERLQHHESLRFYGSEGALVIGARVAVVGVARWEIDREGAGAGYREPPRRLVLAAAHGRPLYFTSIERLLGSE
jgi:hypothetical protein